MYFNYHAKVKNLISTGHCMSATIFEEYHHIYPALVLYFDNSRPMPIRQYMWEDYLPLLTKHKITINNPQNIPLS